MPEGQIEVVEPIIKPQERTGEEFAMDKVIDVNQVSQEESNLFWHETSPSNLEAILHEGIVAENFARRVGKDDFQRRYSSSWNEDNVSLAKSGALGIVGDVFLLVEPKGKVIPTAPDAKSGKMRPNPGEVLVPHRIAPRELLGIAVGSGKYWKDTDTDFVIGKIKNLPPRFAIPIYGHDGSDYTLLWPKPMSSEKLRQFLQEKV